MPEWSNGAVSKTVVRVTGPGVRIPLSPLVEKCKTVQSPAKESLQGFFRFWESAEKC